MTSKAPQKLFPQLQAHTAKGEALDLTLYKSDTCFYCHRVMSTVNNLKVPLILRDTRRDPGARQALIKIGGKPQVPCLIVNGRPLYESADIVRFFNGIVVSPAES